MRPRRLWLRPGTRPSSVKKKMTANFALMKWADRCSVLPLTPDQPFFSFFSARLDNISSFYKKKQKNTACRTESRGQVAIDRIEAETGIKGKLTVLPLDLSSQASVKAFTREFRRLHSRLDVLVNSKSERVRARVFANGLLKIRVGGEHCLANTTFI